MPVSYLFQGSKLGFSQCSFGSRMFKTLFTKPSKLVAIFQLYGVVTTTSKLSICWSFVWFASTFVTAWKAIDVGVFAFAKMSVSNKSLSIIHAILLATKLLTFISSLTGAGKTREILGEIEIFDKLMWSRLNLKINTRVKFFKVALKLFLTIAVTSLIMLANFAVVPRKNRTFWILTSTSIHSLHLKMLSFAFFVDMITHRLERLQSILSHGKSSEIIKLYSKLFSISQLINASQSHVVTLAALQLCLGLFLNCFWLCALVLKTNIHFVQGIYRKRLYRDLANIK